MYFWYVVLRFLLLIQNKFRANALVTVTEIQVTNDGIMDTVFNGVTDILYRKEKILRTETYAYFMNPSGSTMAFAQFNNTLVPVKEQLVYEIEDLDGNYPTYM